MSSLAQFDVSRKIKWKLDPFDHLWISFDELVGQCRLKVRIPKWVPTNAVPFATEKGYSLNGIFQVIASASFWLVISRQVLYRWLYKASP